MTGEEMNEALRSLDWSVLGRMEEASPETLSSIEESLPDLDRDSRELAVACLKAHPGPGTARGLLRLTQDDDIQIAGFAAQQLLDVPDLPPAAELLSVLKRSKDPFVRASLFLAVGLSGGAEDVGPLQELVERELDPDTAFEARAAVVRLGDRPERERFFETVKRTPPDEAERTCELLIYVGHTGLAKGLLPWLEDESVVVELDPHGAAEKLRMCDFAVWTAAGLGVKIEPPPMNLEAFDLSMRTRAGEALRALPNTV